jgi:hypothetical protein
MPQSGQSPTRPAPAALNTFPLEQWKAANPVIDDMPVISWLDED